MFIFKVRLIDYFAIRIDVPWHVAIEGLKADGFNEDKITFAVVAEYRSRIRYLEAQAMMAERKRHIK